jgi:hypothetical protein
VPELDIVGVKEIAERLGVKQQTAAAWRHRGLLPPPEGTVSGAPAWRWQTIEEWATATGRLGGIAEFVVGGTRGWRVIDNAEVSIGAGVVVRQVSRAFPQPLNNGTTENHVRFQSGDGQWYQLSHGAYLRGIGAADGTAVKVGKALLAATAAFGAIVVLSEAAQKGESSG